MLDSQRIFKIKVTPPWTVFIILLTSAVICVERVLDRKEIAQYLQNYKLYEVEKGHSKKLL